MVEIGKEKALLLVRYNNYKDFEFISEHQKCLGSGKNVWLLKTGKQMPDIKTKAVMESGGWLVLRAPKNAGGSYTLAHIVSMYYGKPKSSMNYPNYYGEMIRDDKLWMMDSLVGTWFEIDAFYSVPKDFSNHLRLISNGKYVEDVVKTTRSATMYVVSDKRLKI